MHARDILRPDVNPAHPLDKIFKARSIAVIGASNEKGSVGYSLFHNLIGSGFEGIVYPVNSKRKSVQGVRAYSCIREIDDAIDLAVIATPAVTVPGIVRECAEAGVGGLVIISAGFKEAGDQGILLVDEILAIAREHAIPVVGPNCLGFINPRLHINASFAGQPALPGRIAFISQSGALCTAILDWATEKNVGFSYFVSIGSMIDVGFHDLIDYFGQDPNTSSILLYVETLTEARKFMSAARAFARNKPIIVLKSGKSEEGAKAAMSHTGSLAGNDQVFDAAFKRAGVIRVDTIEELFDLAQVLSLQKKPKGNRLAIVTNAGGPGVLATDRLISLGGELARLSESSMEKLNSFLPGAWSKGNPVDILGDSGADKYRMAVEVCLADEGVDGILVILTPQDITDPAAVALEMQKLSRGSNKTFLTSWMGEKQVAEGREILEHGQVPVYSTPEPAVDSFMHMFHYGKNIELLYETPPATPKRFAPRKEETRELIASVLAEGRYNLTEFEGKRLLEYYDIPTTQYDLAASAEEAAELGASLGFPVVMKIVSPDILHKTEVGGVVLNLRSEAECRETFKQITESVRIKKPEAVIQGVLVEKMEKKRYELLIGGKKDPIFGPVIAFGMGGVAVELFKDTNIGLPPLNMALARRLMEETKIFTLLKGYRGMPAADIEAVQFILYKFAYLLMDFPEILEVDINPFTIDETGGLVLDARILLDKEAIRKGIKPYEHLVISPYPEKYTSQFRLTDGRLVRLRAIRPEDEPLEAEMFSRLSDETAYFRFFRLIKTVNHELLVQFTQIDYDREIAIIAELEEDGKTIMAGVGRLVASPDRENAEFAIVVADPWQGIGLGNKLTDTVLAIAGEWGIRRVYATLLKNNRIMYHIFRERGFDIEEEEGAGTLRAELNLLNMLVLTE